MEYGRLSRCLTRSTDDIQPLNFVLNVLPIMRQQGSGCIINIASRAGTVTVPFLASYSTSKAALIKLTECIQKDLDTDAVGDKIQVYACHPGAVQSDLSRRKLSPCLIEYR